MMIARSAAERRDEDHQELHRFSLHDRPPSAG